MNNNQKINIEPIDVVYTWVNGSDPKWLEKRNKTFRKYKGEITENGISPGRFENNDELKYSLRSLDMYMPWVHKIFIVTDNQIPKWLDIQNPKIVIVDHKDIFPKYIKKPVFNSSLIEFFVPRIKDLSEKYIYFNDDFLVNKPLQKNDFFTRDNKPIFFVKVVLNKIRKPTIKLTHQKFDTKTTNKIIDFFKSRNNLNWYSYENSSELFHIEHPEITKYIHIQHTPVAILKTDQIKIIKHYDLFIKYNSHNQFRAKTDLLNAALYEKNSYYQNKGVLEKDPDNVFEYAMGSESYQQGIEEIINIFNPKYKFISISQGKKSNPKFIDIAFKALAIKFPFKSQFEIGSKKIYKSASPHNTIEKMEHKIQFQKNDIDQKDKLISEMQKHLNKIYNGRIWKILQIYFELRDKLITFIKSKKQ